MSPEVEKVLLKITLNGRANTSELSPTSENKGYILQPKGIITIISIISPPYVAQLNSKIHKIDLGNSKIHKIGLGNS